MSTIDILKIVKEKKIKFIKLRFVDIHGIVKSFTITDDHFEEVLSEGMGFDGSSVAGFKTIEASDLMLIPDKSSFMVLPESDGFSIAQMFCDIYEPCGKPFEGDSRYILKKSIKLAKEMGFDFYAGPELEYFYFKDDKTTEFLDQAGYCDSEVSDVADKIKIETVRTLTDMGIKIECCHHEVAPSQHEIDLHYDEALKIADHILLTKMIVKEVAKKYGLHASFMPKPIFGISGSGMHVHQSLFKEGKNAFFDPKDKYYLSDVAKYYIAGLLKHAREITLITSPLVNSYKRLVPGYEAPVYIAWAKRNRSTLIRVPAYKTGKEKATRIEYRSPDPSCSPYLALACMLRAGFEGIKGKYTLSAPIEEDVYEMSTLKRKEMGIDSLPGSLEEAIKEAEKSVLLKEVLGEHTFEKLIEIKKTEWDEFRTHVSDYEIKKYFPLV